MTSLALLAVKALLFPGGTPQEMANALAKVTQGHVAIMRSDTSKFGKVTIEPSDDRIFKQTVKVQAKLECLVGWEGFGPTAWPDYMIVWTVAAGTPGRKPPEHIDSPIVESVGSNKVTIKSSKFGAYLLDSLLDQLPERPIQLHHFYERAVVTVSEGPISIEKLAASLSKAVGAKLVKAHGKYKLDFSASDFRRRMVQRLDNLMTETRKRKNAFFELAELQLKRDTYAQVPDIGLERAYSSPDSDVFIDVKEDSYLGRSLYRYLQAYHQAGRNDPGRENVIQMVDMDRPMRLVISGGNVFSVQAYMKGREKTKIRF